MPAIPALVGLAFLFPCGVSAQGRAARDSGVPLVSLRPKDGLLPAQLHREAVLAARDGKVLLVMVGNTWCGSCQPELALMRSHDMRYAFQKARVVYLDYDVWLNQLMNNDYPLDIIALFTVTQEGKTSNNLIENINIKLDSANAERIDAETWGAPIQAIIAEERAKMIQEERAKKTPRGDNKN